MVTGILMQGLKPSTSETEKRMYVSASLCSSLKSVNREMFLFTTIVIVCVVSNLE